MTKQFNRGGFRGTAVCPTDVVLRLTQQFGPCGCGWGVMVLDESIVEGAPIYTENGTLLAHEKVHRLRARFWYMHPETRQRCEFESFGMTEVVSRDKRGIVTDGEFAKKSLTDALTKAASWLGFSADIHLASSMTSATLKSALPKNVHACLALSQNVLPSRRRSRMISLLPASRELWRKLGDGGVTKAAYRGG